MPTQEQQQRQHSNNKMSLSNWCWRRNSYVSNALIHADPPPPPVVYETDTTDGWLHPHGLRHSGLLVKRNMEGQWVSSASISPLTPTQHQAEHASTHLRDAGYR